MLTVAPFTCTQAKSCLNEKDDMGFKWVRGPVRSQAGGYVFYRGKSTSSRKHLAELRSDGAALERVEVACGKIPKGTRIVEKCLEESADEVISYSRASYLEDNCKKQGINKALTKRLKKYTNYLESTMEKTCSKSTPESCVDLQELEYDLGNFKKSLQLAIKGCDLGIGDLCVRASLIYSFDLKKNEHFGNEFSKKYFKRGCVKLKHPVSCIFHLMLNVRNEREIEIILSKIRKKRNEHEFVKMWLAKVDRKRGKKEANEIFGEYCKNGYITLCGSYIVEKYNKLRFYSDHEKIAKKMSKFPFNNLCMLNRIKEVKWPASFRNHKKKRDLKFEKREQANICEIASMIAKAGSEKVKYLKRICELRDSVFLCYMGGLELLQRNCSNFPRKFTLKNRTKKVVSRLLGSCDFYKGLAKKDKKYFDGVLKFLEYRDKLGSENFSYEMESVLKERFGL